MRLFHIFAVVVLVAFNFVAVAKPVVPDATPFQDVVEQNFSVWDSNGDGVLSNDEIVSALSNRNIHGESAAAIVAIAKIIRSGIYNLPPLTKDYIVKIPYKSKPSGEDADSEDETQSNQKLNHPPSFQSHYLAALKRLQNTSRDLFPQNLPSLEAVHQALGDCTFVSTVGAMVHRDPSAVKRMFTQNSDGSITIRLGNGQNIKLFVTDADMALWTSAGTNGLWLTAL